jgi:hypothetical protein
MCVRIELAAPPSLIGCSICKLVHVLGHAPRCLLNVDRNTGADGAGLQYI